MKVCVTKVLNAAGDILSCSCVPAFNFVSMAPS